MKINLQMSNQNFNECKFQIHWNKLEWVNPRNCNERKNPFLCLLKYIYLKDYNKTANCVGHSKLKPLDTEYFSKDKIH